MSGKGKKDTMSHIVSFFLFERGTIGAVCFGPAKNCSVRMILDHAYAETHCRDALPYFIIGSLKKIGSNLVHGMFILDVS